MKWIQLLTLLIFLGWNDFLSGVCAQSRPPAAPDTLSTYYRVSREVQMHEYFDYLYNLLKQLQVVRPEIDEYILVRANPWLIERLEATDYYRLMEQDSFLYDPGAVVILHPGDRLLVPDSLMIDSLRFRMATAVLDINIPEYRLRIVEMGEEQYRFPVRVGQNRRKYLAMAGGTVDLRTRPGTGSICRVERHPVFINPSDNRRYLTTRRDDGRVTLLPGVPWLEVELDGRRYGQLIHPTTNQVTLGKAYSNGCIGTSEAAAWRIYYHAPLGTPVIIRYELEVLNEQGDTIRLRDIYPGFERLSPIPSPPPVAGPVRRSAPPLPPPQSSGAGSPRHPCL